MGKVRLAQSPWVNHSWHATLYETARGLTTSPGPYGSRVFQIDFDFAGHRLTVQSTDGREGGFAALEPGSVTAFHARLSPDETLLAFLQSTCEAAARLAQWDRASLERQADPKTAA